MAEPKEPLTERELEIVRLVGTGLGNKDIAAKLFLSPNTVKVHLRNIFTKLEASSRTEVTMIAVRNGWINLTQAANGAEGTIAPVAAPPQLDSNPAPDDASISLNGQVPTAIIKPGTPTSTAAETFPAKTASNTTLPPGSASTTTDSEAASTARAVPVVPVAPNPLPLPALAMWRRAALLVFALLVIMLIAMTAPSAQGNTAGSYDPLRIGPSQPRNGLLLRGEASRWYLRAPLPAPRARSSAVSANDRIYVIGGEVDQAVSGDVLMYEPVSNTWTLLSAHKPTPVANTAAAAVDGIIFIPGGTDAQGNPSRNFEALDTARPQWRVLKPLLSGVAGYAFVAFDKQLYLFGGAGDRGVTNNSYRYDIATDTWKPITAMPTPRTLAAAAAVNDRIYVVGGFKDGHELNTCEYYQPQTNTWGVCAGMTVPRSGLGLARVGVSLFAIGGGVSGFIGFNERYDPSTDRWTALETPLTSDWQSVAVAAHQTEFYVFGGYSGGERLALTYVYEVFTNRVFVPAFQSPGQGQK
jgi:DNA-binding CsgD family transcriptional regulator/N-acetylneuraminic acid mutarotase